MRHSGPKRYPDTEIAAPRPPGREHSSRMRGDGPPPSLTIDQARRTPRGVALVRLIRAVAPRGPKGGPARALRRYRWGVARPPRRPPGSRGRSHRQELPGRRPQGWVPHPAPAIACSSSTRRRLLPRDPPERRAGRNPRRSAGGSRMACPACDLAAVNAVRRSRQWRTIYRRQRAQSRRAKQALMVVAVKLLHPVYGMLKHRRSYASRLPVAPAQLRTPSTT